MMRNYEIVYVELWVGADNYLNFKSGVSLTSFSTTWSPKPFIKIVSYDKRIVDWIISNSWGITPFGKVRNSLHKGPFAVIQFLSHAFENLFESKFF